MSATSIGYNIWENDSLPDFPPRIHAGVTFPLAPPNPRVFTFDLMGPTADSTLAEGSKVGGAGNSAAASRSEGMSGGGVADTAQKHSNLDQCSR